MQHNQPAIYIMSNQQNGTLYVGVTAHLIKRVYQHKYSSVLRFTKKYACTLLVHYELADNMASAIQREKQIKAGSRKSKLAIIERSNPDWDDLYSSLF